MGTPASLLDLIATGGSRRLAINAELTQRAAQAKQAEAAARHADAETEKANIEAEAMRQAQADQQVISDAFAHVGGNPALMDKYIRANASGAGVQRWQMDNMKLREQMAKASAADLDRAEKVHRVMGSSLAHLNEIPDEQLQAEYAKIAPAVQQLDPSVQLPAQIDRMSLKRLMGQLTYADEVLKTEKERAALKQTEEATASAAQEAVLKERGAFLQAIRPDMSAAEYSAVRASFPNAAKSFPAAPGQWMRSAAQEAVKVGDRAKVEQEARVLAGMSPEGVTAEQNARLQQSQAEAEQRARQHRESLGVTMRGQNMTDERAREMVDLRPPTEAEAKTYTFYSRMKDADKVLESMAGDMAKKSTVGQAVQRYAPNVLQSEENQVYRQAAQQFTEAYLRRDSGAAISSREYDDVNRQFFPQPGDGEAVLKRKAEARANVIDTLKRESGRAIQKFGQPSGAPAQPASDPNIDQLKKQFPGATITRVP